MFKLVKINYYAIGFKKQMIDYIKHLSRANFITLSTDIWTSKNIDNSFLALNSHFF